MNVENELVHRKSLAAAGDAQVGESGCVAELGLRLVLAPGTLKVRESCIPLDLQTHVVVYVECRHGEVRMLRRAQ